MIRSRSHSIILSILTSSVVQHNTYTSIQKASNLQTKKKKKIVSTAKIYTYKI